MAVGPGARGWRAMKFALFYEIPIPRPWHEDQEHQAYKNVIEQAVLGDAVGFHSFWTVEHHFLEEYSHCSNPEVLYGAIAARTSRIRIGYGVRLLPAPYNHPIRTAESVAVLDLISDGRVEFGTGRSSTRAELEGFGVDPHQTRAMWSEALGHIVGAWTNDVYQADGKYWKMDGPRRVLPRVSAAAPSAHLGRHQQPRWAPGDGPPRCRAVLVHRGRAARGAGRANRAVPRGSGRVPRAGRQVRQRPGGHLHHGPLRPDQPGGVRHRGREFRLVRQARGGAHRLGRRVARGQRARQLQLHRDAPRSTIAPAPWTT